MISASLFAAEARLLAHVAVTGGYDHEQIGRLNARSLLCWKQAKWARDAQCPVRISLKEVR